MAKEDKPVWQTSVESLAALPIADPIKFLQGKSANEAAQEAERNKLAMEMLQAKARAEQELAIAERIRTAVEVEIEDYYDVSGHGQVGVDAESSGVGMRGGGQKVARRIVRLKGVHSK